MIKSILKVSFHGVRTVRTPDRPDVNNFSVELLDWWHQIENKMCDHVYDSKSRQMLDTLENEKEYAKNILEAVDSALVALNHLNQG